MSALLHPAGKRFLMRKSSNTENMPPVARTAGHVKKADALVSAREASRRRRARVVSGQAVLRKVVENVHRRVSKPHSRPVLSVKCEPAMDTLPPVTEAQEATAADANAAQASKGPILQFPRWLARPQNFPQPFNRANIDVCSEEIREVPHNYILRGLDVQGHSMWQVAMGAIFDTRPMGHTLPQEIKVVIADHTMMQAATRIPSSFPTHVLAVWEKQGDGQASSSGVNPETGRHKVSLMPVHNIIMAAYCANWFPMAASSNVEPKRVYVNKGGAMGTQLTLPVVPIAVPHLASFQHLLYGLYTHKVSRLLDEFVPVPKPSYQFPTAENPNPQNPHYIKETGRRLAARYQPWAIASMIRQVIGLWHNVCRLGISDKRVWIAIDWSWDMLLTGLACATGNPEGVPRPAPMFFRGSPPPKGMPAPLPPLQQPPVCLPWPAPPSPTA
ncbi:hypothetical protein BD413DRAFT_37994 [Trametes elegans]|nr:hypothetical protein BD413DRAFT_37994 [Trametes elegans]